MLERFYIFAREQAAAICNLTSTRVQLRKPVEAPLPVAAPLTTVQRWARATGTIAAAITSSERVKEMQATATYTLDAADYTLQNLLEDLATVMPIAKPADGSELRAILAEAAEQESRIAVGKKVLAA